MKRVLMMSHILIILLGGCTMVIGGYYLLADWTAGDRAYAQMQRVAQTPQADMASLAQLFASQQAHRINFYGELLGMLLGAVLSALGLIGLELNRQPTSSKRVAS